jgi:hypothetical protein
VRSQRPARVLPGKRPVRSGPLQIEQVVAASQVQGGGFDPGTSPLGQEVGDGLGAEGVVSQRVLPRAGDFVRAVAFGPGDDFLDVMLGMGAFISQVTVRGFGLGSQGHELHEPLLLTSAPALGQQLREVIGIFDVLVARVAARVRELARPGPLGHGALIQPEPDGCWGDGEPVTLAARMDFLEGFVVDPAAPPSAWRRRSPIERVESGEAAVAGTVEDSTQPKTW